MMFVISYDIPENRRRLRVSKALKNVGERVQKSVFEVHIEARRLKSIINHIQELTEPEEDSVRFYPTCAACKRGIEIVGLGVVTEEPEIYIL